MADNRRKTSLIPSMGYCQNFCRSVLFCNWNYFVCFGSYFLPNKGFNPLWKLFLWNVIPNDNFLTFIITMFNTFHVCLAFLLWGKKSFLLRTGKFYLEFIGLYCTKIVFFGRLSRNIWGKRQYVSAFSRWSSETAFFEDCAKNIFKFLKF